MVILKMRRDLPDRSVEDSLEYSVDWRDVVGNASISHDRVTAPGLKVTHQDVVESVQKYCLSGGVSDTTTEVTCEVRLSDGRRFELTTSIYTR
jgi:hypothetical protein